MYKRNLYNRKLLERCVDLLKSSDIDEQLEAVVLAAFVIEQTFKAMLHKLNPLLYVDHIRTPSDSIIAFLEGKLSSVETRQLRTLDAKNILNLMCSYKKALQPHKAILEELFIFRNFILHSIDDFREEVIFTEIAASALKICSKYITQYLGLRTQDFNPLTSREFRNLQARVHDKRVQEIKDILKEHRKFYEKLSDLEVAKRSRGYEPDYSTGGDTWINRVMECFACGEDTLNEIISVDFDWNPDGILGGGGTSYYCPVCELDLSESEYHMASGLPIEPILKS